MIKNKKGIALILAVGILALLAGIATSFALNMRLEYKAAINYYNGVKAHYLAEAGAERAIYELKTHVQTSAFDYLTEQWAASTAYTNTISGDTAESAILDEQRKVNVNTANQTLLENLFQELGMSAADASTVRNKIISNRPAEGYINLQELISIGTLTESEYNIIEDKVTVCSYVDDTEAPIIIGADTGRAPVNINTCSDEVLRAILTGLSDGSTTVSSATVTSVFNAIKAEIAANNSITTWATFEQVVDGSAPADEATIIKDNCNSNKTPPSTSTTEFCFNSGGYYEITGTGDILVGGLPAATREIRAIVRIYDIYTQTTKDDFRDEDLNGNNSYDASLVESGSMTGGYYRNYYDYNEDGDTNDTVDEDLNGNGVFEDLVPVGSSNYNRVTWLDSCPVESTDLFGDYSVPSTFPDTVRRIPGSIKLGYWDDFDLRTMVYTRSQFQVIGVNSGFVFADKDFSGLPDLEFWSMWPSDYGKFALYGDRWTFGNFALRVFEYDVTSGGGPKDQAWILFRGIGAGSSLDPCLLLGGSGNLWWGAWGNKIWAWQVNGIDPLDPTQRLMDAPIQVQNEAGQTVDKIYFANDATATNPPPTGSWDPPLNQRYPYPAALKLWPNSNLENVGNWNAQSDSPPNGNQPVEYYTLCPLSGVDSSDTKTFNLHVEGSIVKAYAYRFSGDSGGYVSNDFWPFNISNATGRIALYGQGLYPCWDDLRIIPDSGTYISKNLRPQDIDPKVTGYDVNWCTIVATVTIPTSAENKPGDETVSLRTLSNNDGAGNWQNVSGEPCASSDGTSIQYEATLSTGASDLQETPVLEDIVITYLPKTKVASYTISP